MCVSGYIIIFFAIRQLANILLNFTMLMLLIHTYATCVDYSPYQSNVFSKCYHVFDHLMCIRCYEYQ